jgi:hypothetical protein
VNFQSRFNGLHDFIFDDAQGLDEIASVNGSNLIGFDF